MTPSPDCPRIRALRAYTIRGGGGDYHDQPGGHWIDTAIATPMGRWPEYRATRRSFGLNILGPLLIEVEAEDGFGDGGQGEAGRQEEAGEEAGGSHGGSFVSCRLICGGC